MSEAYTADARTESDNYDAARTDDHGNDPAYAPFDARDDGCACGNCRGGALRFVGGAPLPGWMGTPDGDREEYACDTCGQTGTLSKREGRAFERTGACAAPDPDTERVHVIASPADDPHDGEDYDDYLAGRL